MKNKSLILLFAVVFSSLIQNLEARNIKNNNYESKKSHNSKKCCSKKDSCCKKKNNKNEERREKICSKRNCRN